MINSRAFIAGVYRVNVKLKCCEEITKPDAKFIDISRLK